jgi:flagellar motor switch protein FliN/FliY
MSNETEQVVEQDETAEDWAASKDEQGGAESAAVDSGAGDAGGGDEFQQIAAKQLSDTANPESGEVKLDVILDIPVTVGMEIGRTQLSIRNLLQLNQGSIVELDRLAGEPMDVLVNGTLVAHGEVVVVNEKFGIRLTDVVSPADRIKNLR